MKMPQYLNIYLQLSVMHLTINAINCWPVVLVFHDFDACSFGAGPMLTGMVQYFTKANLPSMANTSLLDMKSRFSSSCSYLDCL